MENVVSDAETGSMAASIRLRTPINIQDLVGGDGVSFDVDLDDLNANVQLDEQLYYDSTDVIDHLSMTCLGLETAAGYEGAPFAGIRSKMTNVSDDDKVMKRVLREGVGDLLEEMSYVTIHYNAYVEFNDEPFDSTYIRKSPHRFRLKNGEVLPGLDIAVSSMKRTEKSQFLVDPAYAYGPIGCFERVPKNATILYEVEVLQAADKLPVTDRANADLDNMNFTEVIKLVKQSIINANAIIERSSNYKGAIREYNQAASRLEMARLNNFEEQVEQNQNLLRLYTNLAISYNRIQNPQRCCINCDKVFRLVKGTSLVVPAKLYYNHAKALMNLNDLKRAEKALRRATGNARNNPDVVRLFLKLNQMMEEHDKREKALAVAMLGNNSSGNSPSEELKIIVKNLCEELKNDDEKIQFNLPDKLTDVELKFIKATAKEFGFILIKTTDKADGFKYKLSKVVNESAE